MERLTYQTLEQQGYNGFLLKNAPERVLQFGEGNFLRAFVEDFIDQMNEKAGFDAKVVLVQPRGGHPESADLYTEQNGLYTLVLRGRENGEAVERTRVISCASRCLDPKRDWDILLDCAKNPDLRFIISNTTAAGIVFAPACKADDAPPSAFPAKLTAFLHRRWTLGGKGFIILSCELKITTATSSSAASTSTSSCGTSNRTLPRGWRARTSSALRWWIASSPAARKPRRPRSAKSGATRTS